MEYSIDIKKISIIENEFYFELEGCFDIISPIAKPKLIMCFENNIEDRRIPVVIKKVSRDDDAGKLTVYSGYRYFLNYLFWNSRNSLNDVVMTMNLLYGEFYEERIKLDFTPEVFEQDALMYTCFIEDNSLRFVSKADRNEKLEEKYAVQKRKNEKKKIKKIINQLYHWFQLVIAVLLLPLFVLDGIMATLGIVGYTHSARKCKGGRVKKLIRHVNDRIFYFSQHAITRARIKRAYATQRKKFKNKYIRHCYNKLKISKEIKENRIAFISLRRTELSGNFEFVYNVLKEDVSLDLQFFLNTDALEKMSLKEIKRFAVLCATSKVILLDEYTPYIHYFDIRKGVKIIQLWHACGAFKTFGFTRLGKPKGSPQATRNHRNYDYVTVSTKNVKICHSEGFGIPINHVVPTGIPRTDVFFDAEHKENVRKQLYIKYPVLLGKKIVLFAPTFRGDVKETSYYPMNRFNVASFLNAVGEEYFLIIKHHPFITKKHPVPEEYTDRVLDMSEHTEINDLLFITDIIITDYSSLVFEASLLNIPMLFYTFDLKDYIKNRDFYFDFETFVPGKFVETQEELEEAVRKEDFENNKVESFKKRFFDDFDGHSTDRVAGLIYNALKEQ